MPGRSTHGYIQRWVNWSTQRRLNGRITEAEPRILHLDHSSWISPKSQPHSVGSSRSTWAGPSSQHQWHLQPQKAQRHWSWSLMISCPLARGQSHWGISGRGAHRTFTITCRSTCGHELWGKSWDGPGNSMVSVTPKSSGSNEKSTRDTSNRGGGAWNVRALNTARDSSSKRNQKLTL